MRRRAGSPVALLLGTLVLAGCGVLPASGPALRFDNQTNTPAAVHVNGAWVGTYPQGASVDVSLAGRGQPPYEVTVHWPSGAVALQLDVTAADIRAAASAGMSTSAELPCGTIQLSFGLSGQPPPVVAFAGLPACT